MGDTTKLVLEGVVEAHGGEHICEVSPEIGGVNVITEIEKMFGTFGGAGQKGRVTLGVEHAPGTHGGFGASGAVWSVHGFGGTDVTPYEPPEITVGGIDVLQRLYDADGKFVILEVERR
jgi:hypothetical protein